MTTQSDAFLAKHRDAAEAVSRETGIPVERILAQAGLESGWNVNAPGNNFFGVKASKGWDGQTQTLDTTEDFGRGPIGLKQNFRKYGTPEDSFRDWAKVIGQDNFKGALDPSLSDAEYARTLKAGGYATDPDYEGKLASTIATTRNALYGPNGNPQVAALPPPQHVDGAGAGSGAAGADPNATLLGGLLSAAAPSTAPDAAAAAAATGKPVDPWAAIGSAGKSLMALGGQPKAPTAGLLSSPVHQGQAVNINPFLQSIFG
jgi:hypothetical protein